MNAAKTVLIVDDNKPLVDAVAIELKSAGYRVITAEDGKKGFELSLREKPKLILLDILMPNLDGLEMLKKLRLHDDKYCNGVPVIILSNLDSEEVIKTAKELKCSDFLVKTDTSLSKLVQMIKDKI